MVWRDWDFVKVSVEMESVGKRVKKVVKKHKRKNVRRSVEPPMFGELKVNLRYLRQKLQCLNYLFFFSV